MAARDNEQSVARFLDPQGNYFVNRLISQEDLGQQKVKNLDLVIALEQGTIIMDDTKSV